MTSFSGISNLFIPMLIASLIVLNTMMGSVYERFREIGIYSSVGLAPGHISWLFIAESCVYSVAGRRRRLSQRPSNRQSAHRIRTCWAASRSTTLQWPRCCRVCW